MITMSQIAASLEQRITSFRAGVASAEAGSWQHGAEADVVLEICARLIIDLAQASGDPTLLPTAVAMQRMAAEFRTGQEEIARARDDANAADYFAYAEQMRSLCTQRLYKSKSLLFHVDMSSYRESVATARQTGGHTKVLDALDRYLDEKAILGRIYVDVRDRFKHRGDEPGKLPLPTLDELTIAFDERLADAHRRARNYVR